MQEIAYRSWEGIRISILIVFTAFLPVVAKANDFTVITDRIVSELLQVMVEDAVIAELLETQRPDGTWPGINYEDVSRTGFEHRIHSANLVLLSRAYVDRRSKFRRNRRLLQAIRQGVAHWVERDYFCDNWWHNQIGTPTNFVHVMLLVGQHLPRELVDGMQPIIGRAHLNASGARPSGDRIKIAGILAKNLLFMKDYPQFEEVIRVIEGEIKFAEGRGMQYDFSFHHREDRVNNTLSYGLGYADAFVEWAVYVAGTSYAFSDEKTRLLVDYYLDGIVKTTAFGTYPDTGAKNRSIARPGALKPLDASTPKKLLLTTDYRKQELEEVITTREKSIAFQRSSYSKFFWHSEHFTFQRPHYFASVRMYSTRNANMEEPYNSEGLKNHHRGDGTNHLAVTGKEYYDIFPVMDYQKVPGATILQKESLPDESQILKWGTTEFVGGASDGLYGMVAYDFKSAHDPLGAKKAWFFFDEGYVCLGSGISARSARPVFTTLNQNLLEGKVTVFDRGGQRMLENGLHDLNGARWVHSDSVGYLFPDSQPVHLFNGQVTGLWTAISKQSSTPRDTVTENLFSLWLDHGPRPVKGSYSYMVFPGISSSQLADFEASTPMEIIANTEEVQAVRHKGLGLYQLAFYRAGELELAKDWTIKMDSPGLLMIQLVDGRVAKITASDPSRRLSAIHFQLSQQVDLPVLDGVFSTWNPATGATSIRVQLPEGVYAGSSAVVEINGGLPAKPTSQ
ncbi:polysaccharide lyase (hyaluronidase) [Lunatimonas lonarensis]|uniref:Polysaccharide lyase (Hyaluronidase) n=1 Tax=Lunatimonas lonarensis TaxID=1232681 RepID=R7ZZ45_9BACT|nr:polysaccharide lyase family 8 super-sandwich domain-containing protein [Lunatimonas lonarensis]EON79360.1 polysaccharide lyase (hyaluronidase) [Lunatimonas lonarensis]